MQKSRDRKEDQITAAHCQLGLVRNCKRAGLEGNLLIPSFPHRDLQSVTVHELAPSAGFLGIRSENADLDACFGGDEARERVTAASGTADENANRFNHSVVDSLFLPVRCSKLTDWLGTRILCP